MKGINIAPLPNKDIKTQKNKYILVQFKGGVDLMALVRIPLISSCL
jgi:hypothetical protein